MAMVADRIVPEMRSNSHTAFHGVERNTASGDGSAVQAPQVFPTRVSRVMPNISLFSYSFCTHRQCAQGLLPRCSCRYRLFRWLRRNLLQYIHSLLPGRVVVNHRKPKERPQGLFIQYFAMTKHLQTTRKAILISSTDFMHYKYPPNLIEWLQILGGYTHLPKPL